MADGCAEQAHRGNVISKKTVTRRVFEQSRRNTSDLAIHSEIAVMRTETDERFERLAGEVVLVNAALNSHGARLNTLTQDVALIRLDLIALRRGQEELHARLEQMEARLDRMETGFDTDFARVHRKLDALLAAVVPPGPAAGA